ncbi:hypothetical protein BKA62DRAFT_674865 [Auriculariales sp. MPI-PUGE-AT-0066]|nr:hypothetical protein BKA62DRAFT_674865 [Auriculariales sp. MPI-PUGE-AT-0066]
MTSASPAIRQKLHQVITATASEIILSSQRQGSKYLHQLRNGITLNDHCPTRIGEGDYGIGYVSSLIFLRPPRRLLPAITAHVAMQNHNASITPVHRSNSRKHSSVSVRMPFVVHSANAERATEIAHDPEGFLPYQISRNDRIIAGDEGPGMRWTVALDCETGKIACVMRTEQVEDVAAVPYKACD